MCSLMSWHLSVPLQMSVGLSSLSYPPAGSSEHQAKLSTVRWVRAWDTSSLHTDWLLFPLPYAFRLRGMHLPSQKWWNWICTLAKNTEKARCYSDCPRPHLSFREVFIEEILPCQYILVFKHFRNNLLCSFIMGIMFLAFSFVCKDRRKRGGGETGQAV